MTFARLRRSGKVTVTVTVACVGVVALIVSPFSHNPFVPLVSALVVGAILVISAVSLSRRDPVTVLTLMLVALYLVPGVYVIVGPLKSVGNPAELLGLLALALWASGRALGLLQARSAHPIRWMLFVWTMTTLIAFGAAMMRVLVPEESSGAVRSLFPFAALLGIALLAVDGLRTREMAERVLYRLVVVAGVSAAIGIIEYATGFQYRTLMHLPGLTPNAEDVIDVRNGFVRVYGGASHPIEYAVVLVAVAPIALHFALTAAGRWRRRVAWSSLLAILAVTPMTVSRSGVLGLTVALIVYSVHLSPRARLNGLFAGLVGLIFFRAAVPGLLGTLQYLVFAGSKDSSITSRTDDYAHIPALLSGHELFGRGLGTFAPTHYFYLDNQYLLSLLEGGLLAVAVLLASFVIGMSCARGYRKRSTDPSDRSLGQALAGAVAAFAVAAAAFDEFSFRQTFFTYGLLLGAVGALWTIAKAREEDDPMDRAPLSAEAATSRGPAAATPRNVVDMTTAPGLSAADVAGPLPPIPSRRHAETADPSWGLRPPVAFAFAYHTWADAVRRDLSWSADQMAAHLIADGGVPSVVVSDPLRSRLGRFKRRDIPPAAGLESGSTRRLVRPFRWRRADLEGKATVAAYRRFDWWLSRQVPDPRNTVLVTCHPVHAAVADRQHWRDVVYYAWDDWLEYPPFASRRRLYAWSYAQISRRDVNVIGVSPAVVSHIGARRGSVVPNGVRPDDYRNLPPPPAWFRDVRRPIALYAGALEHRVDVDGLVATARGLRDWSIVLVGPLLEPELFRALANEPNVHIHSPVPRPEVLAMATAADVCIIPHRDTPMSRAMSPLKLYEYLGAGTPVVASDLPPMRGVSDRCILVHAGDAMAPAIRHAATMSPQTEGERREFLKQHSWDARYAVWVQAALGSEIAVNAT